MNSVILWYDIGRQGATNESMAENPTLKDLSGNGNDATCYNFGWSGMSGIGGYSFKKLELWNKNTNVELNVVTSNKVTILNGNAITNIGIRASFSKNTSIKIKVEGSSTDNPLMVYKIGDNDGTKLIQTITEDNVYTIGLEFVPNTSYQQVVFACNNITIEQLPIYPNALVSDGVDDYAAISGLPIQNWNVGYTVIAKRKTLDTIKNSCLFSKRLNGVGVGDASGAFQVERVYEGSTATYPNVCFSYGGRTTFEQFEPSDFIYQTSKSYCGHPLTTSSAPDSDTLSIFKWTAQSSGLTSGKYVLYSLMLFNRDLTDEEIQWVKNNLIQ